MRAKETETMTRDEMKRYFDRYAYQTRHGTDVGADLVLDEAMASLERVFEEGRSRGREEQYRAQCALNDALAWP